MTLALVKCQVQAAERAEKKADKWKVFRDASEARERLGLQDRSLAVLDALLSFYPDNELSSDAKMVVFPSNAQLTVRAHGIAGATLRRHIALLVEAGLIVRKDSDGAGKCGGRDRLHPGAGRAHQLGWRLSEGSDGEGKERGVFARADADGAAQVRVR